MRAALFTAALGIVLAGCGASRTNDATDFAAPLPAKGSLAGRETCVSGEYTRLGNRSEGYAAVARGSTRAFRRPDGKVLARFERLNANGVATVFSVLGVVRDERCDAAWYRVQLPIRPNGVTGYVAADNVGLYRVRTRIEVDLSERRIAFFRKDRRLATVTAGIGASDTPTPTGRFYVNQRLRAPDPAGPYGPGAIGISAFSPVLTNWVQGGPIAIHGTNHPESIGQAISNGCLRIANRDLLRLFDAMPEGTPVVIRA